VTERALSFGADGRLVGILTEPDVATPRVEGAPAALLWNVGVNHHIGPHRSFVDLARSLAAAGITSLRFDLSGLGDSSVRRDAVPEAVRATDDLNEAAAVLEKRTGIRTLLPVGFCSSIDSAHAFALKDPRVVGACFLEGYAYRTRGFYAHYPMRLLSRERWRRFAAERLPGIDREATDEGRGAIGGVEHEKAALREAIYVRDYPEPEKLRADYEAMVARGVRMLFVYTGGDSSFNHVGQFDEMLGTSAIRASGNVELEYYPDVDHTFFRVAHRERVITRIVSWAKTSFVGGA